MTPDDVCLFIYTSGTTGPPKGCLLSHGNYRAITDAVIKDSVLEDGDSAYLFLPLAHAFAILIQFTVFELGVTLAYWSGDAKQIIPDLTEVKPSFFPSVPRMFEKIYTLATNAAPDREQLDKAVELGVKVRMAREAGEEVPAELESGVRAGRRGALQERARAVRRQHPRVRDRRGADRPRDPALLLRLRRAGDGGLRHDRDLHQRHGQPPDRGTTSASARWAARRTAWR